MKVILSISQADDGEWRDLELPATRPLAELLPLLLSALGGEPDRTWQLWAAPPERPLSPDQTLADAGVWDGSWLLMRPTST